MVESEKEERVWAADMKGIQPKHLCPFPLMLDCKQKHMVAPLSDDW